MSDVLVVGDDLTGSNGAANGLVRMGLRAGTLRAGPDHRGKASRISPYRDVFDALVLTTDSRHLPAAQAARLTRDAVFAGWPARLVASRCDSTLRGNVGPQAEAVIRAVEELSGQETIGLCMPAFPSAGRETIGGLQLMGGRRLEQTELARDVRSPVTTSSVAKVLTRGTRLSCAHLGLAAVTAGAGELETALLRALADSPDVVIADAYTDAHLAAVARAAIAIRPQAMWVTVDPGPGTWALTAALGLGRPSPAQPEPPYGSATGTQAPTEADVGTGPILAVSGSATELTRAQLDHLVRHRECTVVRARYVPGERRIEPEATATAVLDAVAAGDAPVILLATVLGTADLLDLTPAEGEAVPAALGDTVARILARTAVSGLYTTGGDITTAVLDWLGGAGIEVHGEVVPLAAAGTIVGGGSHGLPIVTKGGLVGDSVTATTCVDTLARLATGTQHPCRADASDGSATYVTPATERNDPS